MQSLNPGKYDRLQPLIKPLKYHLTLTSIIKGYTNAHVYIDNIRNPRTAFLWNKGKAWLLGLPNEKVTNNLAEVLEKYKHYLVKHGAEYFRLHYNPPWTSYIPTIFSGLRCEEYNRSYFQLDARQKVWRPTPPDGIKILQVDEDLLSSNYENVDLVREEMRSECASVRDFLDRQFAYVALDKTSIVSWCMSEYTTGSSCELGIATVEEYRRRGIATQVAKEVICHALKNHIYNMGWHCWRDNVPSVNTALKIGFKHKMDYPIQEVSTRAHRVYAQGESMCSFIHATKRLSKSR